MIFAEALIKAYNTNWSYINTFTVNLAFNQIMANEIGWTGEDDKNINLNIVNIDTPQFTNQNIEVFVGNKWIIHNGRDELYRFSITFRDQDKLKYYRKFLKAYHLQKNKYFDDIKMTITLSKDADYVNEQDSKLFDFTDTMIENISQLQFNNTTEAQIAEFTVNFKCILPIFKD